MKIAYGVMGYGRGHAMRTAAVLPTLMKQHEVTVYAGQDAYEVLAPDFPTVKLPIISYEYDGDGKLSPPKTVINNLSPIADLLLGGKASQMLDKAFAVDRPDVVISDSEAWTHRAAQRADIPRISFDHVGIMAHCLTPIPKGSFWRGHLDGIGYNLFMGEPQRIVISSFYTALPRYAGVSIVGPILRDEVAQVSPERGDYLLVYFNKGEHQFQPNVEAALKAVNCPMRVYGTTREGRDGHLEYRPRGNLPFLQDLAGCRAVLSTAGNQLLGESIHFRKPVFAVPEDCYEQRLNALMIERLGVGKAGQFETLNADDINDFLLTEPRYLRNMKHSLQEGRTEAIQLLEQYIEELTGAAQPQQPDISGH